MLREKAFDFWKTYIGLMTKGGVDVPMTNPAVTFTADAKAGEYDDISDEEYYELLDFLKRLPEHLLDWEEKPGSDSRGGSP